MIFMICVGQLKTSLVKTCLVFFIDCILSLGIEIYKMSALKSALNLDTPVLFLACIKLFLIL